MCRILLHMQPAEFIATIRVVIAPASEPQWILPPERACSQMKKSLLSRGINQRAAEGGGNPFVPPLWLVLGVEQEPHKHPSDAKFTVK